MIFFGMPIETVENRKAANPEKLNRCQDDEVREQRMTTEEYRTT